MAFRPQDTTPDAWAIQLQSWNRMGPARRVAIATELSEELIDLCRAGIAARHPDYDADAIKHAEIRQRLGEDLYAKAYPNAVRREP